MSDRINIRGLRLYAFHGCNDFEKTNGQFFELDIIMSVDTGAVGVADSIDDTVNYSSVIKTVRRAFTEHKRNTIERAAKDVTSAVLSSYEKVETVKVCLKKPNAPLKADFGEVAVEITENRGVE